MPNTKATFWLDALRRTGPEWIAALALAWWLHGLPGVVRHRAGRIGPTLRRLQAEGHQRIPSSRAHELKGMKDAIYWIHQHVPADRRLFYLGRMSGGIRLRYYTFPREAHWHYVYETRDVAKGVAAMKEARPDFVVLDWAHEMQNLPIPDAWRKRYGDSHVVIFEVLDHVAE